MVLDAGDLARRKASVAAAYHQLSPPAVSVSGSAPVRAAVLGNRAWQVLDVLLSSRGGPGRMTPRGRRWIVASSVDSR